MDVLFPFDVVIELGGFLVAGLGSVATPVSVQVGCLLLFPDALAKVVAETLLLNIISRQKGLSLYPAASAFFDLVTAGFHSPLLDFSTR